MSAQVNNGSIHRARIGSASPRLTDISDAHRHFAFVPSLGTVLTLNLSRLISLRSIAYSTRTTE